MRAGKLRHRITIEQPTAGSADVYGERDDSWSEFAERWASVEPLTGREFFAAQQVQSAVTHKVILRHLEGVTEQMRIKHDSRYLYVISVRNIAERDRMLELLCAERTT